MIASRQRGPESGKLPTFVGSSRIVRDIRARLDELAPYDVSVGFTGETGVGKGRAARYLHARSGRSGALITLNCGAIPHALFEAEIFGYRKGAFTDAKHDKRSPLVGAHQGTLLLDEWAEMPPPHQIKLLTAFDERRVTPLGASRAIPFDVRIASATNCDVRQAVEIGRVRQDLYYRVMDVALHIPALRERSEDIVELAQHFLSRFGSGTISSAAMDRLVAHSWPGNVRQLMSAIRVANAFAAGGPVLPEHLPESHVSACADGRPSGLAPRDVRFARFEHVHTVLGEVDWRQAVAAEQLGVRRKTLRRWVEEWVSLGWIPADRVRWARPVTRRFGGRAPSCEPGTAGAASGNGRRSTGRCGDGSDLPSP